LVLIEGLYMKQFEQIFSLHFLLKKIMILIKL
jgi:hypothetical protein